MDLALQATRYKIWLQTGLFALLFGFGLWLNDEEVMMWALGAAATIFVLFLFRTGLRNESRWAAILFALFCGYDMFGAMSRGLSLYHAIDLADAVLSFVAICGIVIWLRERKARTQDSPAT